ncbi:MAG: TetR/AcrR family transcriptional regulator [Pseudomonadota bacterium]
MRNKARVEEGKLPILSEELASNDVLRTAAELFLDKGLAASKLVDIADAAGVSYAEVFDQYGNRETIFRLIVDHEVTAMRTPFIEAIPKFETAIAAARFAAQRQHVLMTRTILPRLAQLVITEAETLPEIRDTLLTPDGQELIQAVGEFSMRGLQIRGLIKQDIDVSIAVRQFYGLINQAFNHEPMLTGKQIDNLDEYIEDCCQWFVSRYGA